MHRQRQRYKEKDHQTTGQTTPSKYREGNKVNARTGAKLPAHFANAVFDKDTGQILDYKKLINHNKEETREWW